MTIEMLHDEMIAAWKHGDMAIKNVLSNAIAQIKKAAIDAGCRDNVSEDFVNAQLLKIKKSIQEQIDTCPVNRIELLNKYNEEMDIINHYAPNVITSESEIKNAIIKISGTDKITKSQRGLIMKTIKASGVLYDMAIVNKIISTMME